MIKGTLDIIHQLFKHGADSRCGQLLHHAVLREKGDTVQLVKWLVEKGAPINDIQYENHPQSKLAHQFLGVGTALHSAAEYGKFELVKTLLDLGADPTKLDNKLQTPRSLAEKKGFSSVYHLLTEAEHRWLERGTADKVTSGM